jgi:3-oxoacyl-[acyl-carrier protein] reductase
VTGRNKAALRQALRDLSLSSMGGTLQGFSGDMADPSAIRQCLLKVQKTYGRIDIFIGNLGSGRGDSSWQATDAEWTDLLSINLCSSVRLARAILPSMIRSKGGSIVFISSIAGCERVGGPLAYGSAKAALMHFSKTLAHQMAPHHVRVNTVAPGNIFFKGGSWDEKLKKHRPKVMRYLRQEVPMGRFATPEEIADTVAFVASPRASFMTGSRVVVDGGQTRSL